MKRVKKEAKRFLALMMAFLMIFSVIPTTAYAADEQTSGETEEAVGTDPTVVYDYTVNTDVSQWPNSSHYVQTVTLSGVTVTEYEWKDNTCYVTIDGAKGTAATFTVTATTQVNTVTINGTSGKTVTVDISDGMTVPVYAQRFTATWSGTRNFVFSIKKNEVDPDNNTAPTLQEGVEENNEITVSTGKKYTVDLDDIFVDPDNNALTYTVSVNGADAQEIDADYTFVPTETGSYTLVFSATDGVAVSDKNYTVTFDYSASAKNVAIIGAETTNGSLDSVEFTDADGDALDCVYAVFDEDTKTIDVLLSRSIAADAKVTATFSLTQSTDGFPFLTSSNSASGAGSATSKKTNVYTTTLSAGQGTAKAYLYNSTPKATSNVYDTYTINYTMQNNVPVLTGDASATAELTAGGTYTLDLTEIFTDADGDELTYTVSVDDAAAVAADADYSYLPETAGTHVLKFTATDGYTTSSKQPVYTVTLTVANVDNTYNVNVTVPDGVTPTFYAVNSVEDGTIVRGDELTYADGVVKVPENISRITWDADGMVGASADVSEDASLELAKVTFEAKLDTGDTDDAATVKIQDADGYVISGTAADSFLLVKDQEYTYTVTLSSAYSSSYNSITLEKQSAQSGEVALEFVRKHFTVIAPKGSVVSAGTMNNYYIYSFATPFSTETVGDTVVYKFSPLSGAAFIRVQRPDDPDAVTYWDYNSSKADGQTITVTEEMLFMNDSNDFDADTIYHEFEEYDLDVADIYLNANEKGCMNMAKGGTYELNIFRDWMAIEGISNAKVALPDMSYKVIDFNGEESNVVSVTPNKNNSSVATITANEEGTAVILVTYDAMYSEIACQGITGTGSPKAERFSAIWPENTGVLVVSVGADGTSIKTNMTINEGKNANTAISKMVGDTLDAEHDDLYYVGDQGAEYTFTPGSGCEVSVARAVLTKDSLTYNGFTKDNVDVNEETGEVTVKGLTTGRHIIKIEKDEAVTYQVVTAKQTSYTITDADGNTVTSDTYVKPGTELTIEFSELYNPINKLSGIYNTNCRVYYAGEDGTEYRGNAGSTFGVYNFASNADLKKLTITVPEDWDEDTYTLNGCLQTGGFGDSAGKHRGATYATGKPVNTTANSTAAYLGMLPEITLNILTAEDEATAAENQDAVSNAKAAIEAVEWAVDMETANDSDAVKAWIEAELAKLDLSDVKTVVNVEECTSAEAGTSENQEGTAGSFAFTVELSKGSGVTKATDSIGNLNGTIIATKYEDITYTVTLPSGKGYKAEAADGSVSPAKAGSDYSFIVSISSNYEKGEDFAVKANGEILEEKDGKYTISSIAADTVVTVTGVVKKQNTENEKVTVYFTVSDDDKFLTAQESGEVMALKKIEVPYFDLEEYDLTGYYYNPECYTDAEGQKPGTQETADGNVTMLHLMIYATEVYYYGIDPETAGQGYLYEKNLLGADGLKISGNAGSLFTEMFWDYDMNLNYYVNYEYPLGKDGWGATADQILLEDGDIVTIGHFTSWNFYNDSTSIFSYAKVGDDIVTTTAQQGEKVEIQLYHAGENYDGGVSTVQTPVGSSPEVYYTASKNLNAVGGNVTKWTKLGTADENGKLVVDTSSLEPGEYVIAVAGQYGAEYTEDICSTPGGILLTVTPYMHEHEYGDTWKSDASQHWKECECGDKTEAADHSFEWVVDKEAAEFESGVKHEECTVCHATRSEGTEIPMIFPFEDVLEEHFFYDAVLWALEMEITEGTSETTFEPFAECTRANVVTFLWRANGCPEPEAVENPFADIAEDAYYYKAILWAAENGITDGTSETTFSPDDTCTRAQIVTFLWRENGKPEPETDTCAFEDVSDLAYYKDAVLWAVEKGITQGKSDTTFDPDAICNRGETVTFLYRAVNGTDK